MAFDEQGQAETVERKVEICERAYDLLTEEAGFAPEDSSSTRTSSPSRPGSRSTPRFARDFIEATCRDQGALPRLEVSGGISNLSFSFRGNDVVREAMHSAFLYHAIRAGLDMGDRQRGPARRLRGHPGRPARARRGRHLRPPPRRDRAARRVRRDGEGRGDEARARPLVARGAGRRAARARARARDRRLHRGGHRGGAAGVRAAARRDRGAADGRDEDRRRPVRLGEDVPAAGGEERPRDEARGRLPRAVHGGGEGRERGAGEDRARHGQGRRPRHRQEHRRRRARLQQLRGDRPRRDGLRRPHPRHRGRGGRARGRALRADHAVARRDGLRRPGDGAARARPAAPDRRRDDVEAAHGGQDRARPTPRRRSTCSTPRASSASSPTCSTRRGGPISSATNRGAAGAAPRPSTPSAPRARSCSTATRSRTARSSTSTSCPVPAFTGTRTVEPDARDAARLHRLDVLLRTPGS